MAVETNGTIVPNEITQTFVMHYSVSPKLVNAGEHKRSQSRMMGLWPMRLRHGAACLKFVVTGVADIEEAGEIADANGWPRWNCWIMPEGRSTENLLAQFPQIAAVAVDEGMNVSQRLHVLAWGDTRGT